MALSHDEIVARSKRLNPLLPVNRYTGTLNDPLQEAQSRYMGPAWDEFFGGLAKTQEDAQDAGKSYRVGWGGFGNATSEESMPRTTRSLAAMRPDDPELADQIAGNQSLAAMSTDQGNRQLAIQDYADQKRQQAIDAMKKSYQEQVLASAVPQAPAPDITRTVDAAGNPKITMRPNPNETPAQRVDSLTPGGAYVAGFGADELAQRKQAESEAVTNAKIATETGPGSLVDFINRIAKDKHAKGETLTAKDIDDARKQYLDTTASAGTQGPKVQEGLEQKYRDILAKQFSSRSGDLGVQSGKISQASHLLTIFDQAKDKNGNYNLNPQQLTETALGLANLISGGNGATQEMTRNLTPDSLKGDVGKALQYVTGQPQNGSTQELTKLLRDSIIRQGKTAQDLRGKHFDEMRALAPTDLAAERRAALEKGMGMTNIDAFTGGGAATAGSGPKVDDVVTVGGKRIKISAIHPDGSFDGNPVK